MSKKGLVHEKAYRGQTNEWYTPQYITDALGHFLLDPCAAVNRNRDIADKNYTIEDDGLSKEWNGRTWLNPPYGEQTKIWLERMAKHNDGVVLIFARTDTKMFHRSIWPHASGIFFFDGRLKFVDEQGESKNSAGAPSCLISYDHIGTWTNYNAIRDSGLKGKFIGLRNFENQKV